MKSFIVALCLVGYVLASDQTAQVVQNDFVQGVDGFNYAYKTENEIYGQAEGKLKVFDKDSAAVVVNGANQYQGPDGVVYALKYVADENGYHPEASYLPTPPAPEPIPEYIVRSLAFIEANNKKA